ncbi:MAG: hypothetical protein AAFV96_09760 [Pseudomonadota bacterium]
MTRRIGLALLVGVFLLSAPVFVPSSAEAGPPRWEYWEGRGEIARERREMRRDILRSRAISRMPSR